MIPTRVLVCGILLWIKFLVAESLEGALVWLNVCFGRSYYYGQVVASAEVIPDPPGEVR